MIAVVGVIFLYTGKLCWFYFICLRYFKIGLIKRICQYVGRREWVVLLGRERNWGEQPKRWEIHQPDTQEVGMHSTEHR